MKIGGFQKQTLIDYPGKISSLIFTQGCNFRCPFCHNSQLVLPDKIDKSELIREEYIFDYLKSRYKFVDAVVITGGEPAMQPDLKEFCQKIKDMGFLIKLDTNGSYPHVVKDLIESKLIDYIAVDIKAPLEASKYSTLTGLKMTDDHLSKIQESLNIIMNSPIQHEFRTTVIKELHSPEDIHTICKSIPKADKFSLQKFNPTNVLKDELRYFKPYSDEEMSKMLNDVEHNIKVINIR